MLNDGANTYTYGLGRISQSNTATEYFLGDALGSVRQLTASNGNIALAKNYDPYGVVTTTNGTSQTSFGFIAAYQGDSTELIYLRARYYNPQDGRFQSRDTWEGNYNRPLSLNRWNYVEANPVNFIDPSGKGKKPPAGKGVIEFVNWNGWSFCIANYVERMSAAMEEKTKIKKTPGCFTQIPEFCITLLFSKTSAALPARPRRPRGLYPIQAYTWRGRCAGLCRRSSCRGSLQCRGESVRAECL